MFAFLLRMQTSKYNLSALGQMDSVVTWFHKTGFMPTIQCQESALIIMSPKMFLLSAFALLTGSFAVGLHVNSKALPRIEGGAPVTDFEKFAYQVALLYRGSFYCGGSIASLKHIITAAHCTDLISETGLAIKAGTANLIRRGQLVTVKVIHQHENYSSSTSDYDIAVLELSSALKANPKLVRPIELSPSGKEIPAGASATVSGWGSTRAGGLGSPRLMQTTVRVVSAAQCIAAYNVVEIVITDRMFCATAPGTDSCHGDDGGPLVVDGKLAGVVSFGLGCANGKFPGVYTKIYEPDISSYIRQIVGE